MLLALILACQKPKSPVDFISVPILPAPEASNYAIGTSEPKDILVREQSMGLPWEESLSGAAAKMGLDFADNLSLGNARWAATIAGYPYSVEKIISGRVPVGEIPEGLSDLLSVQVSSKGHVGLARVRIGPDDLWVALIGSGGTRLPPFSRLYAPSDILELELPGLSWRLLSPSHQLYSGDVTVDIPLDESGEWWLEIYKRGERVSSLPLYVGVQPSPTNLFVDFYHYDGSPEDLSRVAHSLVNQLRKEQDLPVLDWDGALATMGIEPLRAYVEGRWNQEYGIKRLERMGFGGGPLYQFACSAKEIGLCLDEISWSIDGRLGLLDEGVRVIGIQSEFRTDGVSLIVSLASL